MKKNTPNFSFVLYKTLFLTVFYGVLLSGCVIPPTIDDQKKLREDLKTPATQESVRANRAMPKSDWWRTYQDSALSALIEKALALSPSLDQAKARLQQRQAYVTSTSASLLPTVSVDGSVQKNKESYFVGTPASFIPQNFQNIGVATLNFQYEFDFFGKNTAAYDAAEADAFAAVFDVEQAKIVLSTNIAAEYAKLLYLLASLKETEKSVDVRRKTANLFSKRYGQGLENEGAVYQAKANLASMEAEAESLKESIQLSKNALTLLIGEIPNGTFTIQDPKNLILKGQELPDVIPSHLLSQRPDILAMINRLDASAKRIHATKAGFYPSINFIAAIGQQSLPLNDFFKRGAFYGNFGPSIHLPIFQAQQLSGLYKEAHALYNNNVAAYEDMILHALHSVNDALCKKKSLIIQQKKTKESLDAAAHAYHVTKKRYEGGLSTYLEVLRAEDTWISARKAMTEMDTRTFMIDVQLIKALGGGFLPPSHDNDINQTTKKD